MINKENIEAYILQLVDGELDSKTHAAVMQYIATNNDAAELLEEYQACKLIPDEHIVFENKLDLYAIAQNKKGKLNKRGAWIISLGIAASIALMIAIFVSKEQNQATNIAANTITATPQKENTPNTNPTENTEISNNSENKVAQNLTAKTTGSSAKNRIQRYSSKTTEKTLNAEQYITDRQNIVSNKILEQENKEIAPTSIITLAQSNVTPTVIVNQSLPLQLSTKTSNISNSYNIQSDSILGTATAATTKQKKSTWLNNSVAYKKLAKATETATEILASVNDIRKDGISIDVDYGSLTRKQH
jgi:hypothetical protein